MKKIGFIIVIILFISSMEVLAILSSQKIVPSTGIIIVSPTPPPPPATIGISVFSDAACTMEITNVNWGNLNPGDSGHQTLYLKNTGNVNETVTMAPGNWNPLETQTIANLSWDCEGVTIEADGVIQANLTLDISGNVSGIEEFAFDIIFSISS